MAGMVSRQCGMRNAECGMSGESHCVSDLSLQFRIPHSTYGTKMFPDPLLPSLVAVTRVDPAARARITADSPDAASTRATVESPTDQVTTRPDRMFPWASRSVAK